MLIIVTLMSFENSEKPEWLYKNQHQILYISIQFNQMFDQVINSSL